MEITGRPVRRPKGERLKKEGAAVLSTHKNGRGCEEKITGHPARRKRRGKTHERDEEREFPEKRETWLMSRKKIREGGRGPHTG